LVQEPRPLPKQALDFFVDWIFGQYAVLRYAELQQQYAQLVTTYQQIRTQYLLLQQQAQLLPLDIGRRTPAMTRRWDTPSPRRS
jgi:hypothetical protein